MSLEGDLQTQVMQALKQLGIYAIRVNSGKVKVRGAWMQLAPIGTWDLVVFPEAKMPVWLELKEPKGRLSAEQFEFADKVTALGHKCFVVRRLDDLLAVLKELR